MARLGPWPAGRRVAVAVSGGADSMALVTLAASWGDPLALIVDHGLRPESAAEARLTAARLAARGIPSRLLPLTGLVPGPALAARARAARYVALESAALAAGCPDLLLGHHRRDQAETLLIRRAAGSGGAGLAGMPALRETARVRLVRPLLTMPPGALRAWLRAIGVAWVEDPSNANPDAARARVRAGLADPDGTGARTVDLAARARRAGGARAAAEADIGQWLGAHATMRPEGFVLLPPGPWPARALAAVIRTLSGAAYPPDRRGVRALAAAPRPAVLGGVRFLPAGRLGPGILAVREAAAMAPPVPATDGASWDGRWRLLMAPDPADNLTQAASFGAVGVDAPCLRRATDLPAAVLATLPALRRAGALAMVPAIGYPTPLDCARVTTRFDPPIPLAGAAFVPARLPGDAEPAACPHLLDRAPVAPENPGAGWTQDWME